MGASGAPKATANAGKAAEDSALSQVESANLQGKQTATTECEPKNDKKAAKLAFNAVNFLGLHWVGNSALSLWITYNIANKKPTQKFLHGLADAATPAVNGMEKIKSSIGLGNLNKLSKEMRELHIKQSARSFTETAVMCFAGSIILFPVKWLEDHRTQFVDKVDGWIHPSNKNQPKAATPVEEEHKETWGNLIRSRVLALFPIFAIDNRIQSFNNIRASQNKPNLDTLEWNMGAKLYDNMKPSTRESFINFFSRKGISTDDIQPLVKSHLEQTVGKNPGKMVFAEQTRMFSKEVSLTLIYTGFLFLLGKTPLIPATMKMLGLSKKDDSKKDVPEAISQTANDIVSGSEKALEPERGKAGSVASRLEPRKRQFQPSQSHSSYVTNKASEAQQLSI